MRKKSCVIPMLFIMLFPSGLFSSNPVEFRSGEAEIEIKDHLHHPLFQWPATLLEYPVIFDEGVSAGSSMVLLDGATSEQRPFQLANFRELPDGRSSARLYLISDLPSGGEYVFVLKKGTPEKFPSPEVEKNGDRYTIRTDKLCLEVPASRNVSGVLPGPVLSLGTVGGELMGNSRFNMERQQTVEIRTSVIGQGPLFVELEVEYLFPGGGIYRANIRCVKGYDFIELRERMEGFHGAMNWEILWDGFSPTHRQAPNHPYGQPGKSPGFARFAWEKIDQDALNSHHGIMYSSGRGKIPFEIGIYGNWPAERIVTSATFWDERANRSVGVFTKEIGYWDDREYSIWSASGKLNLTFHYNDAKLRWVYPVSDGSRSTAISCYPHQNDIDYMDEQERLNRSGGHARPNISQLSYNSFLQNRHSTIDLNRVKDWELFYPAPLRIPETVFPREVMSSVEELERRFYYGSYSNELAASGPCQNSGYGPTPAREFYNVFVPAFNQLLPRMTPDQRERLSAMFLMHAYVAAGEEYMPMRTMLSGHPNFLADVRTIPLWAAFLFPEHNQAGNWSDMFAKYVELNTHYHTRPDVPAWNAKGGRWTENLGTYVWAFLGPTVKANYLVQHHGSGKNHLAQHNVAQIASWIVNALSAPYNGESLDFYETAGVRPKHFWGIASGGDEPRRVHPPQGAHAARRKPSSSLWVVGEALQNYDPLLAENIRYVSSPRDEEMEQNPKINPFGIMYPENGYDEGTPPDLKSTKMTGYGIILRSAVGTKDELSIHLPQIDQGPNYRWGIPAEGGCGNVYFFAAGKSFSHNGREDSGDRKVQDTDLTTNFGVFKDGRFKSIGRNDLKKPLYDFSVGQFAEITSSPQSGYSWPEYQGRSIMLVGSDYFIVYDDVYNNNIGTRMSWFTHPDEYLPEIRVVKSADKGYDAPGFELNETRLNGKESKGVWYDGSGDMLTFVSHKKNFTQEATGYGCVVTSAEGERDYIFRGDTHMVEKVSGYHFAGRSGFIRQRERKDEFALFDGSAIGNNRFEIRIGTPETGISAVYVDAAHISGECYTSTPSEITFHWTDPVSPQIIFYLDGERQPVTFTGNEMKIVFPTGKHIWNIGRGLPVLCRPEIVSSVYKKGEAFLSVGPVWGTEQFRYEYSIDGGKNWSVVKIQPESDIRLKPVGAEKKGHLRVRALNSEHESEPSSVYPIYFTSDRPHCPEGLKLIVDKADNRLTWGAVLGCGEYRLYRREKGEDKYTLVYEGEKRSFDDRTTSSKMYEYVVSAVNGNGESIYSHSVDNDPDSWLNFTPVPGEPFRRVASRNLGVEYSGGPGNSTKLNRFYYP